jgi:MoxR-like ATPase
MKEVSELGQVLAANIERVIVGKADPIRLTLLGLFAQGHILIEDVPGTGKTVLAKSLARSIGGSFHRIQFTPDMLPSDVTGVSIFNQQSREFEFRAGPVIAQIVLIDEINRATPKTQAALLEAMEERQVTVDGVTYLMPTPFLVLATQNPIEYEGTFPLPEAQLDRFFMRISLGYPMLADEIRMLEGQQMQHPLDSLQAVASVEQVVEAQRRVRQVRVADELKRYILDLVTGTRRHHEVYLGASPRGSLALFRASQALAALAGRDYILPDDIKTVAIPTLAHRMIIGSAARIRDVDARMIVQEVVGSIPVPGGDGGR